VKAAHQLALWTGVAAMLGNLVGLKVLDLLTDEDWLQLLAGLVFSFIVGALAYARERVKEAQREAERHDTGPSVPGRGPPPY
jgi:uncharacterized membrane protein YfcA